MNKKLWIITFVLVLATTAFAQSEADFMVTLTDDITGAIIKEYIGKDAEVTIPSTIQGMPVKEIGNGAFANNSTVTSVVIPEGVIRIGSLAVADKKKYKGVFTSCINLKTVTLPEGLKVITNEAFFDCRSLDSITLPSTVKRIGAKAFSGCVSLTSIDFPASIETVGNAAFAGCSLLTAVNIPDSVIRIRFPNNFISVFSGSSKVLLSSRAALKRVGYMGDF
jgi:hypothetical protein